MEKIFCDTFYRNIYNPNIMKLKCITEIKANIFSINVLRSIYRYLVETQKIIRLQNGICAISPIERFELPNNSLLLLESVL